ncbi:MAG: peptidoglycan glycosyltransferase, partial [Ruminococcus sp.]|nr:peptidoglycan glycosyltransferase [Ruminococcus sp.]
MISDNKKLISLIMSMTVLSVVVSCSSTPQHNIDSSVTENNSEKFSDISEETTTKFTEEFTTESPTEPLKTVTKGNIYDAKGNLLMYTEKNADGSEKRKVAEEYAIPLANIITEMSDGYDLRFNEILSTSENESEEIGKSIQLTIDADVQNAVYNYMESANIIGSAVIMRTDGSILSQVSYPSYDPATVEKNEYNEELAWGECGNKAFQNFEPGSCFKIMSEVISDKHGVYSVWDEGEWTDDGATIVNWDHDTNSYYPMERSLYSAFTNSSNIFFAKSFDQIGKDDVLKDLDEIFHFVTDIQCDFGDIQNNIEITCNDDLRRSAFGQSYILTCPIYLATLGREAVFGDMVRP